MLTLKTFGERKSKENLRFDEWVEKKTKNNEPLDGKYLVTYIFAPKKYPYAKFVFETENERVNFTVSKENWAIFKHTYGLTGADIEGKEFYVYVKKNKIDIDAEPKKDAVYEYNRSKVFWKLVYDANVEDVFEDEDDAVILP